MTDAAPRRFFVALTLPEAIRAQLAGLSESIPGFAWTDRERLHLTMRFLGDVPKERMEPLLTKLRGVRVEPFILPVEGAGFFPPRGPTRVIWIGTGRGHPRLFQLRQRIDDAILSSGLNVEMTHFSAHVTVARIQPEATEDARAWALRHRGFVAAAMRVDGFTLFESVLAASGPAYVPVERVQF